MKTWGILKGNGKLIKYHFFNSEFIDKVIIIEGDTKFIILYRPTRECLKLTVKTDRTRFDVCNYNEDPFFTRPIAFSTADVDSLIERIKKYIKELCGSFI